jgi:hypothetical protein
MTITLNEIPIVVSVCIKLHNYCTENNLKIFTHVDDERSENDSGPINPEAPDGPFSYKQSECATEVIKTPPEGW